MYIEILVLMHTAASACFTWAEYLETVLLGMSLNSSGGQAVVPYAFILNCYVFPTKLFHLEQRCCKVQKLIGQKKSQMSLTDTSWLSLEILRFQFTNCQGTASLTLNLSLRFESAVQDIMPFLPRKKQPMTQEICFSPNKHPMSVGTVSSFQWQLTAPTSTASLCKL